LKKNWKLKTLSKHGISASELSNTDDPNIDDLIDDFRGLKSNIEMPEVLIRLLYMRGITDYQKVLKFFKPTIDKLYDPALMKDAGIAADRIIKAINDKEDIMILGDYDVDGTCGVSMFYLFLKKFGLEPEYYIPDRIEEGYGISMKSINYAKEKKIALIVAIDCGITAFEKVEYAKSLGIEFIICDHHQPPENIPNALAVMDPMRVDDDYPFKYLCGTGVAFKLAQFIAQKLDKPESTHSLLDLVAIATASDIVPLNDENRILVSEGFKLINNSPRPSLKLLIESSGLKAGNLNTGNVVFTVAPRINAVGRLGDAKRAVELLICEDDEKIKEFTSVLNVENTNRRDIDKSITENAFKQFEETNEIDTLKSIVIHNEDWHSGVIGIVAARLVEKYNLPSIVLTTVNGVAKGSARSINTFNIYEALKQCEDKLIQFGGHFHAAGLEVELSNLEEFKKSFNSIATNQITDAELIPEIEIDAEISFEQLTDKFIKILDFFEPYGPENMTPVFVTRDVQIIGDVRYAKSDTHIFKVRDRENKKIFEAVYFNSPNFRYEAIKDEDTAGKIVSGNYCDICYSIEKNYWNNRETTKLRIRDMKFD